MLSYRFIILTLTSNSTAVDIIGGKKGKKVKQCCYRPGVAQRVPESFPDFMTTA
jgi:hypothetical protein